MSSPKVIFVKVPVKAIEKLHRQMDGIGRQANKLLTVFDWEPYIVRHLARVSKYLRQMRKVMRSWE